MTDERRYAPMDALLTALGYDADAWACVWVPLCDDCGGATVRVEGADVPACRCSGGEHD